MRSERERIARFLNLEGNHPLLFARIRGIRSVDRAREFRKLEELHAERRRVLDAIDQRLVALGAEPGPVTEPSADAADVRADGGAETVQRCPDCDSEDVLEESVGDRVGLWCRDCADFVAEVDA